MQVLLWYDPGWRRRGGAPGGGVRRVRRLLRRAVEGAVWGVYQEEREEVLPALAASQVCRGRQGRFQGGEDMSYMQVW